MAERDGGDVSERAPDESPQGAEGQAPEQEASPETEGAAPPEEPSATAEGPPPGEEQAEDGTAEDGTEAEPTGDEPVAGEEPPEEAVAAATKSDEPQPATTPQALAAEARYSATGKRKSSVARVILRPGGGEFELNGRPLDAYFPRLTLQAVVRQPLEVTGYLGTVDVRARIHGGGTSSQADAVRHGIAKALIEIDPGLRGELKRRQLLTRDPRVKERRKAGLKKARKRPQFSKR
jgi:small subunit ribosomal protein S9